MSNLVSHIKGEDITLRDVFEAFEEPGAFCLKLLYHMQGDQAKVDYNLTLSCYSFTLKASSQESATTLTPEEP